MRSNQKWSVIAKATPVRLFGAVVLLMLTISQVAARQPHPVYSDQRIKQVLYDPNQVVDLVGTYGYVTTIEFAPDEVVTGRTFGDSIAWQTLVKENHLYLKPVEPDASGNMTVVTNRHTYLFKLISSTTDMTFMVRFKYPDLLIESGGTAVSAKKPEKSRTDFNPATINMQYAAAGHKSAIALQQVFDDGEFTYFQFAPRTDAPAIYFVESDGTESIVNIHRDGAYLVVERVGRMFVLRNGDAHLCVENGKLSGRQ